MDLRSFFSPLISAPQIEGLDFFLSFAPCAELVVRSNLCERVSRKKRICRSPETFVPVILVHVMTGIYCALDIIYFHTTLATFLQNVQMPFIKYTVIFHRVWVWP